MIQGKHVQRCSGTLNVPRERVRWGLAVLLAGFALAAPAFGAVERTETTKCNFIVSGPIEPTDAAAFHNVDCSDGSYPILALRSPGGDVDAAMAIGRWARSQNAITIVGPEGCYSSCALIYIGGVTRLNYGEIGLHRPYLSGNPRPASEVRLAVGEMIQSLQDYVAEMGVTPDFAHIMINTPPNAMQVFHGDEIHSLVPERDPISDELTVARRAAEYGLSTEEYRRRDSEADAHCDYDPVNQTQDWSNCRESLYWGLSRSVYLQRSDIARKRCTQTYALTDEDWAVWRASGRDESEHPLEIKTRDCWISVMNDRAGRM